jgi:hypothetical protein
MNLIKLKNNSIEIMLNTFALITVLCFSILSLNFFDKIYFNNIIKSIEFSIWMLIYVLGITTVISFILNSYLLIKEFNNMVEQFLINYEQSKK